MLVLRYKPVVYYVEQQPLYWVVLVLVLLLMQLVLVVELLMLVHLVVVELLIHLVLVFWLNYELPMLQLILQPLLPLDLLPYFLFQQMPMHLRLPQQQFQQYLEHEFEHN